ncbi:MAG: hypothetical protein Q7T33_06000 [Dehalococcoidia bacterium]|nr:hypothetical protein [Dehalococcoidia bacterium]
MSNAQRTTQIRTRAVAWFTVFVFARLYTAVLNDFLGRILGLEFISYTWIHGIPTYLWLEIIFYGPIIWLALTQVNADVFGDVPAEPEALRKHRRLQFIATFAIAILIYGIGVHVTDTISVLSEREQITDGAVYDLVYFLDEGLSHYIQFFPLFFVMGWFLIHDRPGRTAYPTLALFLGVVHGIERGVGIIEGEKWFLGPAVLLWMATAAWLRWRRVGSAVSQEFFFRHALAFCVTLPVSQAMYYIWFDSFPPPSALSDSELTQMAAGAVVLTVVGTVLIAALDRWWHKRRLAPVI